MGFKNSNVLFVFLCARSEVLRKSAGVFSSQYTQKHSLSSAKLFPPSLPVSPLHSLLHFPSALYLFFLLPLFMSACFLLLSVFCFSPPTVALCIPARRGGGVCDPDKDQTSPPCCPPLVFTLGLTPSLGKWAQPSPLAGHQLPFQVCCQPGWQQSLSVVCLSAATFAPATPPPLHYCYSRSRKLVSWGRSERGRLLEARGVKERGKDM